MKRVLMMAVFGFMALNSSVNADTLTMKPGDSLRILTPSGVCNIVIAQNGAPNILITSSVAMSAVATSPNTVVAGPCKQTRAPSEAADKIALASADAPGVSVDGQVIGGLTQDGTSIQ